MQPVNERAAYTAEALRQTVTVQCKTPRLDRQCGVTDHDTPGPVVALLYALPNKSVDDMAHTPAPPAADHASLISRHHASIAVVAVCLAAVHAAVPAAEVAVLRIRAAVIPAVICVPVALAAAAAAAAAAL